LFLSSLRKSATRAIADGTPAYRREFAASDVPSGLAEWPAGKVYRAEAHHDNRTQLVGLDTLYA
jgi:hypothetical protein